LQEQTLFENPAFSMVPQLAHMFAPSCVQALSFAGLPKSHLQTFTALTQVSPCFVKPALHAQTLLLKSDAPLVHVEHFSADARQLTPVAAIPREQVHTASVVFVTTVGGIAVQVLFSFVKPSLQTQILLLLAVANSLHLEQFSTEAVQFSPLAANPRAQVHTGIASQVLLTLLNPESQAHTPASAVALLTQLAQFSAETVQLLPLAATPRAQVHTGMAAQMLSTLLKPESQAHTPSVAVALLTQLAQFSTEAVQSSPLAATPRAQVHTGIDSQVLLTFLKPESQAHTPAVADALSTQEAQFSPDKEQLSVSASPSSQVQTAGADASTQVVF